MATLQHVICVSVSLCVCVCVRVCVCVCVCVRARMLAKHGKLYNEIQHSPEGFLKHVCDHAQLIQFASVGMESPPSVSSVLQSRCGD